MSSKLLLLINFCLMGCANTYHIGQKDSMQSGMSEDAQDYPTKYNMMDSPDGSKNPNAQVRVFGATY